MAISTVRAQFNGTWHTLTLNSTTGLYEVSLTAPSTPQNDMPLLVRVVNSGGFQVEAASEIDVKWEIVPPTAAITGPAAESWYTDPQTPVSFTLRDEAGGSGIDLSTLDFILDGETLGSASAGMVCTAVTNGYDCVYTPPAGLSEGAHTASVTVMDAAGNLSPAASVMWNIDNTAPALTVSAPADGLVTNNPALTIAGTAGDTSSGLTGVTINGESVSVTDGVFSKAVTLSEGTNDFTIVATDAVGYTSTVTRSVLLDSTAPAFVSVSIQPDMEADPLGSLFVITVQMAPSPVSPKSAETVTGAANGVPMELTEGPEYTWTAKVSRSKDDSYSILLHSEDAAGNSADYAVTFPCGLAGKWDWTPPDFLNFWDLNRIEYNTRYLYAWLQERGYGTASMTHKTDWSKTDIPLRGAIERIRENVDYLRTCYFRVPEWMEIIYNNTVDAGQMNAFEWDLHLVDLWMSRMARETAYSGEFFAGEYP